MIKDHSSLKVAEFLLQIKAVIIQPKNPFTWASGWKSPMYCDNRRILSFPQVRTFIRQEFVKKIENEFGKPDVIAGVATGGIPMGALVAQEMNLPFIYVRPEAKGHGLTNQIEGAFEKDQIVVVIEDLISTGGSSLKAVDALRKADLNVKGLVAVFSYGFEIAAKNFEDAGCKFTVLTNYETLIDRAMDLSLIEKSNLQSLKEWRTNPSEWAPKS
jgi:orotate phosphoribosyltransferase